MRLIVWFFWIVVYAFRPKPRDLQPFLIRGKRRRLPWWKFRPYVWHDEHRRRWGVWFDDDEGYTEVSDLKGVEIHRSMETHQIVGLTIPERVLKGKQEAIRCD